MTADTPLIVRVTRRFTASAERVFDAWLDTKLIGTWMFGPALREEEVLRLTLDPRVGGAFSFLVRRQGLEIDHVGVYREIQRPRRLVFTWGIAGEGGESADESVVTIDIAPLGTGAGGREGANSPSRTGWTRSGPSMGRASRPAGRRCSTRSARSMGGTRPRRSDGNHTRQGKKPLPRP